MEILLIIVSAIFVNNIVLAQFLGICPFLGVSNKLSTATGMSAAVCFVITLATIVTYLLNNLVLVPLQLQFLQTVPLILSPAPLQALGIFVPLITTPCAVLGVAITVVTKEFTFGLPAHMLNLGEAVLYAFATSLGYGLAMILFSGMREQLAMNDVPKAFKGVPIALVTVSILAMAFMGFSGMV